MAAGLIQVVVTAATVARSVPAASAGGAQCPLRPTSSPIQACASRAGTHGLDASPVALLPTWWGPCGATHARRTIAAAWPRLGSGTAYPAATRLHPA